MQPQYANVVDATRMMRAVAARKPMQRNRQGEISSITLDALDCPCAGPVGMAR
jgi:hypothetical protein